CFTTAGSGNFTIGCFCKISGTGIYMFLVPFGRNGAVCRIARLAATLADLCDVIDRDAGHSDRRICARPDTARSKPDPECRAAECDTAAIPVEFGGDDIACSRQICVSHFATRNMAGNALIGKKRKKGAESEEK